MSTMYRLTDLAQSYLLDDADISFCAKGLYTLICHVQPKSFAHLVSVSGVAKAVVKRECKTLKEKGWVSFELEKSRPTIIIPTAPDEVQEEMVEQIRDIKASWVHYGESIMKAMLDNAVASRDFLDNCRPTHIANPRTGYCLEFDRLYHRLKVAFEFQGAQHRKLTPLHQTAEEFEEARMRDLIKMGLSTKHGIDVVEITAADLTIDRMIAKIPSGMPLVRVDRASRFIRYLNQTGQEYLNWSKRRSRQDARSGGGGA